MTVLELINELLHLPPDAEVRVTEFQGCRGASISEVRVLDGYDPRIDICGIE